MKTKFKPTLESFTEFTEAHTKRLKATAFYLEIDTELTDEDFDYFFEYYLNSGEMPYGVAKARDGDPYEWVAERIIKDAV
jgi:hypothetical protein